MKHIQPSNLLPVLLSLLLMAACKPDEVPNVRPSVVKELTSPANEARIELPSIDNVRFEWKEAEPENTSAVNYEIVFDKAEGDFTQPLHTQRSANEGRNTNVTIGRSALDLIAEKAGAEAKAEAKLKWMIRAKAGEQSTVSEACHTLTLVRLNTGRPQLQEGEQLFIGGEGAEAGQPFKQIANGTANEIYTRLESGKPFYLYSRLNGTERIFALTADGKGFEETAQVPANSVNIGESGIYRIKVDFATTTISYENIGKVTIRMSANSRERTFDYAGKGTWKIEDYNISLAKENWGVDERYKLIFYVNGQEEHWGRAGDFDNRPSINLNGYRDMAVTAAGQWEGKQFKFPIELCDNKELSLFYTDITISMTAEKNYTHDFSDYYYFRPEDAKFTNPVFEAFSLPDPDVIRGDDGYFYLYATEHSRSDANMKNSPIMRSADLIHWEHIGALFTDETHPQITNGNAGIWAPTISKVGDKYAVYYSQPGNNYKHAIGVATADTPAGPFTDHGKLIDSDEQGVDISIDAYLYQEDGRNYLFWGSFREISVIELTADGLAIKPGAVRKTVAGGQYEASYVHKKYGYYYLIVSTGDYSKGGTYRVVVGRSRDIMGPYVNKAGKDMMSVNHELMMKGNDTFTSPGHSSRIITDDAGNDWILYHAYKEDKNYRILMLDQVTWENEWPVIGTGYPSLHGYVAPVFNK